MFLDISSIFVTAGNGGDGVVSFHTEKFISQGGPDGGDGGNGGSIVFEVDLNSSTLMDFKFSKHFRAVHGGNGAPKRCTGKTGKDLIIKVPRGTVIKDKLTGSIIMDMFEDDASFVLESGGQGGKGNARFANALRKAPRFSQKGEKREEREITLELKTIADVGLVGFPNVGKSTMLSIVSGAKPKIANYHFTTLAPNIGVVEKYGDTLVMADIPGLIEGASEGAGLGHSFLRHVERVRLIVHVVDISGHEGRDPYEDYLMINRELNNYSPKLARLEQVVCVNKIDLINDDSIITDFEAKIGKKVHPISAIMRKGVDDMISEVFKELAKAPEQEALEYNAFTYEAIDKKSFHVSKLDDASFLVEGGLIDQLVRNVVLSDYESFRYFQKMLKDKGVISALKKKGAKEGNIVRITDIEFEYVE